MKKPSTGNSKMNIGNSCVYLQTGEVSKPWRGERKGDGHGSDFQFKILNGIYKVNSQDWFTKAVNRGTRGTSGLGQDLTWSSLDQSKSTEDIFSVREWWMSGTHSRTM
jgi:hypothetical protein